MTDAKLDSETIGRRIDLVGEIIVAYETTRRLPVICTLRKNPSLPVLSGLRLLTTLDSCWEVSFGASK